METDVPNSSNRTCLDGRPNRAINSMRGRVPKRCSFKREDAQIPSPYSFEIIDGGISSEGNRILVGRLPWMSIWEAFLPIELSFRGDGASWAKTEGPSPQVKTNCSSGSPFATSWLLHAESCSREVVVVTF